MSTKAEHLPRASYAVSERSYSDKTLKRSAVLDLLSEADSKSCVLVATTDGKREAPRSDGLVSCTSCARRRALSPSLAPSLPRSLARPSCALAHAARSLVVVRSPTSRDAPGWLFG